MRSKPKHAHSSDTIRETHRLTKKKQEVQLPSLTGTDSQFSTNHLAPPFRFEEIHNSAGRSLPSSPPIPEFTSTSYRNIP